MTSDIVSVEIGRSTWQGPAEEAPWRADNRDADMAECAAFSAGYEAGERDGRASGQQVRAGRWRVFESAFGRGWWGIEIDGGLDADAILPPQKIAREDLEAIVDAHNAALTPAPQPEGQVRRISELRAAIVMASDMLSRHRERFLDSDEPDKEDDSLRQIEAHLQGAMIGDDEAAFIPAPSAATPTAQTKRLEDRTVRSIAEGSTTLLDTEIMQMMAQEIEDHRRTAQEAVAWRCKDYADGWVLYGNKRQAECYQRLTGCLMEALYTHPPQPSETVADVHQRDLTRPIIGIENRTAQEVFDIMSDRIRAALRALKGGAHG